MLFSTIGYRLWSLAVGCGLWGLAFGRWPLAVGVGCWLCGLGVGRWLWAVGVSYGNQSLEDSPQQPKTSQESLQTDRSVEAYPQQVLVPFSGNQNPNAPNAVGSP